jgi:hypothetical protein
MESNTQLIANDTALADPWKRTKIENIALLLRAAIEAQGRVGLMLNVKRTDLKKDSRPAAGAAASDDLLAERRRVGGGQHDHRRAHSARPDPQGQGRGWTGHSRIPPQQDCVVRIVESTNRRAIAALLAPERTRDAATERTVAKIVADVKRGGDAALRRYAKRFDGSDGALEITAEEMRAGAAEVSPHVRPRHSRGGPQHPHGGQAAGAARLACPRRERRRRSSSASFRWIVLAATCPAGDIRSLHRCS